MKLYGIKKKPNKHNDNVENVKMKEKQQPGPSR